ncbi:MAG TPA: DUF4352 domain-containing protein [Candidatus Eremiobacteraceae bacterium]|nr:DUF4352 domain-containing protein [Candidatus Eremiobacteraceae bacterium]
MIFAAVVIAGVGYLRSLPVEVVAVGTPVRQDDFRYTVTRVLKHRASETVSYIVTIRVDNDAKQVVYVWRDDAAYVEDSAGRRYPSRNSKSQGQRDREPILAGDSASYDLTFDVPAAAAGPMLRYSNGILMGDVFDLGAYTRAAVPL